MGDEELFEIKPAVKDQLDADVFMILSELIKMLEDFNYEEERKGMGYGQYQKVWARGQMMFGKGMKAIHQEADHPDRMMERMVWMVYTLEDEKEPRAEFIQQVLLHIPNLIIMKSPICPEVVSEFGGVLMDVFKNFDENLILNRLETYYNRYLGWYYYNVKSNNYTFKLMESIRSYVGHLKRKWKESIYND